MNLRRTVAPAVVAAVTAPTVLLATGSAFADTKPAAQPRTQGRIQNQAHNGTPHKPTYAELQKAAEEANRAYQEAAAADEAGQKKLTATLAALDEGSHPLKAALLAAEKASKAADAGKAAADQAVADAQAKLDAATDDAAKAEARTALTEAEARAKRAAAAKSQAHTELADARKSWDDARVAALREYSKVSNALDDARTAKESADQALAAAKKCVREQGLTVLANGLPSKVVAGSTVDFSLTLANSTDRTLDVDPLVFIALQAKDAEQHFMKVQWSNGSDWQSLDARQGPSYIAAIKAMKPGARTDVRMRMTIEAQAPAEKALALLAGDASDQYNPCVLGPMKRYDFEVLPAGEKPGTVDDAKPGTVDDKDRPKPQPNSHASDANASGADKSNVSAQGTASTKSVPAADAAKGSLATTGAPSAAPQLALAGAAAVLLGTGTVVAVRGNRKAGGTS
ncbi:hypothetical protein ADL22_16905 [Streptomyces sp. NRRL F-4489]|uniref:hypothetical protein n=1 Tax=Streptomyces sp. NRRL F-4489 TaxID=1609095 RepID=UPI0007480B4A|nr:hypothetical protein [Streptomyces sp. NRRL F-4489]KUL38922.1 hypothetical protein ADL22_16905 [Streptomyces sp. NRRL F-4489]